MLILRKMSIYKIVKIIEQNKTLKPLFKESHQNMNFKGC